MSAALTPFQQALHELRDLDWILINGMVDSCIEDGDILIRPLVGDVTEWHSVSALGDTICAIGLRLLSFPVEDRNPLNAEDLLLMCDLAGRVIDLNPKQGQAALLSAWRAQFPPPIPAPRPPQTRYWPGTFDDTAVPTSN